jgi:hypothetical protein
MRCEREKLSAGDVDDIAAKHGGAAGVGLEVIRKLAGHVGVRTTRSTSMSLISARSRGIARTRRRRTM